MRGHLDRFQAIERNRSGSEQGRQPQNRFQQRCFAHAVAAHNHDQFPGMYLQIYVLQDVTFAVVGIKVFYVQQGFRHDENLLTAGLRCRSAVPLDCSRSAQGFLQR